MFCFYKALQFIDALFIYFRGIARGLHRPFLLSIQIAMNGFTEVLTWILCSYKENFSMLNRKDDKLTAVIVGNPRSSDFEVYLFVLLIFSP